MEPLRKNRNLLVIAYLFPPISGIAVQRPLKFTKYLQQFGWNPTVLTVANGYSPAHDEMLLHELDNSIAIYRTKDPFSAIQHRFRNKMTVPQQSQNTQQTNSGKARSSLKSSIIKRVKSIKDWIFLPDEHIFWVMSAARMARRLVKKHKIQAIYTTSGPHSTHLVGYLLKKWTGLPWIADFRDPWTQNMHYHPTFLRSRIETAMERTVMRNADIVLTVTNSFAQLFQTKYPEITNKLSVIHNGFDSFEFNSVQPIRSSNRFTLFYAGILYEKRSPRYLLEGLKAALEHGKIPRHDIQVCFAGVFDYPGKNENQNLVEQLRLTDVVEIKGYLPHLDTVARMKGSDVLVLIGDVDKQAGQYIPGKLFEYLGAGRPILSLTVPGEASTLISQYELGRVITPTSPEEIENGIVDCYQDWKQNQIVPAIDNQANIRKFDRYYQTEELTTLLNHLVHSDQETITKLTPYTSKPNKSNKEWVTP